jgi:hypothetical protein
MWYIIFKFRKYLNCETLEMFKYMHDTSYFLMLWKIFKLKKTFRNRREEICHTRFLRPKPDAHRMYVQDQVVIHTVRM